MELTTKLIEEVKKYTMLYNTFSVGYRNHEKKRRIWASIAQRLNENADTCRTKWRGLRDRYLFYHRQLQDDPNYKLTWPHYEQLNFLSNFQIEQRYHNSAFLAKDKKFGLELIEEIKKNELLYNPRHEEFRVLSKRGEIWRNIAQKLNESVPRCRMRWRTLRARYIIHLNNRKVNDVFGRNYEKPRWPFYEAMSFMDDCLETNDVNQQSEEHDVFLNRLVEKVQNHPILYDYGLKDSNMQNRNKAWRKIAQQLNKKALVCKVQFKELLSLYRSVTNPEELEENSEQWKAYYMLSSFLHNIPQGNLESIQDDGSQDGSKDGSKDGSNTIIEYLIHDNENNSMDDIIIEESTIEELPHQEEEPANNDAERYETEFSCATPKKPVIKEDFDKFLDETAIQLNTLNSQQQQKHKQKDSVGLLFRALARCVQETQLPNHKLLELHAEVTAYVYKVLASYASSRNREM